MESVGRKIFKETEISGSLALENRPFLNQLNQTIFTLALAPSELQRKMRLTYPV